jgi:ABC-type polysaccharide/polyol phosphate export permease
VSSVQALWDRRGLIYALAATQFKGRYRRLGLGVVWSVVNPLIQAGLIAVVFQVLARDRPLPGGFAFPYALFVLSGNMPWAFFTSGLSGGTTSILENSGMVQRVALPRTVFPTASMASALLNFAFMLGTVVVLVAILASERLVSVWLLPAPVLLECLLFFGMSLLTATLTVRYRDIGQLVNAATGAWFWVTPIIYPLEFIDSQTLRDVIRVNPMTGVISLYRGALLDLPVDGVAVAWSCAFAAVFLLVGWQVFRRREGTVADFI